MPEKMISVPANLVQRFVGFIEKSSALLEAVQKDGETAKQAAPAAAETLVKQGLIDESQKAAAVESLSGSHTKALETLRRTATHVQPRPMGEGEEKSASDSSDGMSEKDRNFIKAMGF